MAGPPSKRTTFVSELDELALDDDRPDVLTALRCRLKDNDAGKASRAAIGYVQLVYGRQLQQQLDEQPADVDPLDVASMTRAKGTSETTNYANGPEAAQPTAGLRRILGKLGIRR
jgi:hypothetical protein